MQRKTRILKQRRGFAMIMAIFFVILISTLLSYMLASSSETAKRTTNNYLNEQAQLLAKSAVEYTILRASGHDRTGGTCMLGFNGNYPNSGATAIFDINVTVEYFGLGNACNPRFVAAGRAISNISTAESNGTMMIDVYVSDNINLGLTEPIRYHRRTLQKL